MKAVNGFKTCSACSETKPVAEFSRNRVRADGLQNQCKQCHSEVSRRYVAANPEKHHRAVKKWRESNRDKTRAISRKWREQNPEKRAAHIAVVRGIRAGEIVKTAACQECYIRTEDLHAHHDDYTKPLTVRWLCRRCHALVHAEGGVSVGL